MKTASKCVTRFSIAFLGLTAVARFASASDDPIGDKLAEAKQVYQNEMTAFREAANDWFDTREAAARRTGDKQSVDRVKSERETFEGTDRLPRTAPSAIRLRFNSARNAMESAYESAVRDYTRNSEDRLAAEVEGQLRMFKSGNLRPDDAVRFGGHHYKAFDTRLSWHEAKRECERMGGHLAFIETPQENAFVTRLAAQAKLNVVWLGATDSTEEGTWLWDDEEAIRYTNWEQGQPNNVEKVEHYLVLLSQRNGMWWDYPAVPKNYPGFTKQGEPGFVCEWE